MDLRKKFLDYFVERNHTSVSSSGLIPLGDPTLLFTNAGMVQFKDVFTGEQKRAYTKACSSQKCLRVGGKHNDLENVGHTARHHTFFEMLGNFSFGDYFKEDAIRWSWEFLTQEVGLDPDRLYITVFDDDDEAYALWHDKIGVPKNRIDRAGEKDNFWAMGPTGPCGPCSEVHYDQGPGNWNCPDPDKCDAICDCDRYLEVWNLVFMQFNRDADGNLNPLPNPSIDTGMGLERLQAVVEGCRSNYDSSLFMPLLNKISSLAGIVYGKGEETDAAMRVIADHARAVAFLLAEGVLPGNEGRGYVVRRLIRRALRYARLLGFTEPVLAQIVDQVVTEMGSHYSELQDNRVSILRFTGEEEELFLTTIASGIKRFEELANQASHKRIDGHDAFRLYDTFGFPLDLTELMAREKGLDVDSEGFEAAMEEQRARARAAGGFKQDASDDWDAVAKSLGVTKFIGYDQEQGRGKTLYLADENGPVDSLDQGTSGFLIVDQTPLYAESGGQTGDRGFISAEGVSGTISGCRKVGGGLFLHSITINNGNLKLGDQLDLTVDRQWRAGSRRNHTATHLLQAALRQVLGTHVQQAGSLVEPDRLRFDFSHRAPLTDEEKAKVEDIVQQQILAATTVDSKEMELKDALDSGATAFFGEKYGAAVRVVAVSDFSRELCGGTHVRHTGEIGSFAIAAESSVASGVRRIEARTGPQVADLLRESNNRLQEAADLVKTPVAQLLPRLKSLIEEAEAAKKLKQKEANKASGDLLADWQKTAVDSKYGPIIARCGEGLAVPQLRQACDKVRAHNQEAVLILGTVFKGKLNVLINLGDKHAGKLHAGNLIKDAIQPFGAKGGGNPKMGQSGGLEPEQWKKFLEGVEKGLGVELG